MSLSGISSMAMRGILAELAEAWRRRSSQDVSIESVGGVDAARRVAAGGPFDFVVLAADAIRTLESADKTLAGSRVDLAGSGIAVAIAKGHARPDIADGEAVRTCGDGCACGRLLDRPQRGLPRGPLRALGRRAGAPRAGATGHAVAALIARGAVDLGFQQSSELLGQPGNRDRRPASRFDPADHHLSAAVCTASRRERKRRASSSRSSPRARPTQ
jgi:molybdate transport system substrate-binding protein